MAQAAEILHVNVTDVGLRQALLQTILHELRIMAGFGNRADIDQLLDAVGVQQANKLIDRMGRVADRVDRKHLSNIAREETLSYPE